MFLIQATDDRCESESLNYSHCVRMLLFFSPISVNVSLTKIMSDEGIFSIIIIAYYMSSQ